MARPDWLTLPNVITLFRLFLVPVFLWYQLTGRHERALVVFAVAFFSDVLDGALARLLNQKSKFGGVMDPVADKLLVLAALLSLTWAAKIPPWLLALILFRDGSMVVGMLVVRRKRLEVPTQPSRVGKYATFSLALLVVLSLASLAEGAPQSLAVWAVVVGFLAGLCVALSTFQYFARFGYLFFAAPRSASSEGRS